MSLNPLNASFLDRAPSAPQPQVDLEQYIRYRFAPAARAWGERHAYLNSSVSFCIQEKKYSLIRMKDCVALQLVSDQLRMKGIFIPMDSAKIIVDTYSSDSKTLKEHCEAVKQCCGTHFFALLDDDRALCMEGFAKAIRCLAKETLAISTTTQFFGCIDTRYHCVLKQAGVTLQLKSEKNQQTGVFIPMEKEQPITGTYSGSPDDFRKLMREISQRVSLRGAHPS